METNEKVKKNGLLKAIIIITLIVSILTAAGFAYARYITRINGTAQAPIATWNFTVTAGSEQNLNIDLADTRLPNDTSQVDPTKVAPGTAGALILNVNGTGSQVSLEYDINISLSSVPENLIFYSDSNRQNAIYKQNGTINFKGFFSHEGTQTDTITLYWDWPMETGSTQAEINANDILDSQWIGEPISIAISATGKQVDANPTTGQYAVTFDANGGTLLGYGNML